MDNRRAQSDVCALPAPHGGGLRRPRPTRGRMTRQRAIALLDRLAAVLRDGGVSIEGLELLEMAYALAYIKICVHEHTTDDQFDRVVAELAPWLM